MAAESSVAHEDASKGKTKAKMRYLKQKKLRRKQRKTQAAACTNEPELDSQPMDVYDDEGDEDDAGDIIADDHPSSQPEPIATSRTERQQSRPKKRQKTHTQEANVPIETVSNSEDVKPDLPGSLPSFPLPSLPDAPSAEVLALQGAHPALLSAKHVSHGEKLSITLEETDQTMLSLKTRTRLQELGITELFAVQTALVPFLLSPSPAKWLYCPYDPPPDVCVSAPTGSGKTLAYVLPIIESLSTRIIKRLRALIVLPTRDLVVQVRETFEAIGKGRGLKIAGVTGHQSFAQEQSQLIGSRSTEILGGSSKVDILVCTPGRLIDHLNSTPNFSLQHLRYLVIDEADRLLAQSFHEWNTRVLSSLRPASGPVEASTQAVGLPFAIEKKQTSCQKLLFSATLTRDPGQLAALELRDPQYFIIHGEQSAPSQQASILDAVTEKFSMPASLSEHMIISETARKPLMFFHLLQIRQVSNALVFTKSAESTGRLLKLLDIFEELLVEKKLKTATERLAASAYSSDLASGERKVILEKFKAQKINLLIASDLVSRGIDIKHVSHVISYDAPVDMRKYVHRVGRTARAGRVGEAWTLVEEQEARYFKNLLQQSNHLDQVKRLRVKDRDVSLIEPLYQTALDRLRDHYTKS